VTALLSPCLALLTLLAAPADDVGLAELVARLGSRSWHEREAAAEAILRYGLEARPALQAALGHEDPEVRHRARALLTQLRWRPPSGLPPFLAEALRHYTDLPAQRRASLLVQVANAAGERAVPLLREALRTDADPDVREKALGRLSRLDRDAAEATLAALAKEPRLKGWACAQLGDLLVNARRYDEAAAAYEKARQADRGNADVLAALARLYERQGAWRKAIPVYADLAVATPRDPRPRIRLGWCHHHLGEQLKARRVWRDTLAIAAHSRNAYRLVSHALLRAGATQDAAEVLRQACERHPQDYEMQHRLAEALLRLGQGQEALAAYRRAIDLAPTPHLRHELSRDLGRALRHEGELDGFVEQEQRELARLDADIARLMETLARRYRSANPRQKARQMLERLIELYPESEAARRAKTALEHMKGED
jgi:tetratricopeptide (TPR) repeat protein